MLVSCCDKTDLDFLSALLNGSLNVPDLLAPILLESQIIPQEIHPNSMHQHVKHNKDTTIHCIECLELQNNI